MGASARAAGTAPSPRLFYRHEEAPLTEVHAGSLAGLRHRTVIDSRTGARGLALWQEEHLPGFKVPRSLDFATDLPRSEAGKIQRNKVRAPYWEGRARQI